MELYLLCHVPGCRLRLCSLAEAEMIVHCYCIVAFLPVALVGTTLGQNLSGNPEYHCLANAMPGLILKKKYKTLHPLMLFMSMHLADSTLINCLQEVSSNK